MAERTNRQMSTAASQRAKILRRLEDGPATTCELAALALNYTGRVSELRQGGHKITVAHVEAGTYRYTLHRIEHAGQRRPECRHGDPASYERRGDRAYCQYCNQWLGNYPKNAKPQPLIEADIPTQQELTLIDSTNLADQLDQAQQKQARR